MRRFLAGLAVLVAVAGGSLATAAPASAASSVSGSIYCTGYNVLVFVEVNGVVASFTNGNYFSYVSQSATSVTIRFACMHPNPNVYPADNGFGRIFTIPVTPGAGAVVKNIYCTRTYVYYPFGWVTDCV